MDGPIERERRPISEDTQAFGPVGAPPAGSRQSGWLLGDRYRVLDRIGSGGMAEVFRARDEVLQREVAVKVFRSDHFAAGDEHGRERQQLEVQALARLNHPNLITLYDGCVDGSTPQAFIVMELIDGPSLSARIAQGPLPEAAVREIGIQLAEGLAYVHAQGMVHRDVKPDNILLGVDRSDDDSTVRARLSDFGIVRLLDSQRLTSVNLTLGTASYLAPEQARGSQVEPPADIYSLGLVLLEALTGVRVFDGPPLSTAMARLSERPRIPADLPEPWPGLLHAMTESDPALRPPAAEVARILREQGSRSLPLAALAVPVAAGFADAPTGMTAAVAAPVPVGDAGFVDEGWADPPRRRRPSGVLIAATLALLAIATTVGLFLFTGNDSKSPAQTPATNHTPVAPQSASHTGSGAPRSSAQVPAVSRTTARHSRSASPSSSAPSTASSSATPSSSAPAPSTSAPTNPAIPTTSVPGPTTSPAAATSHATQPPASSAASTSAAAAATDGAGSTGSSAAQGQADG